MSAGLAEASSWNPESGLKCCSPPEQARRPLAEKFFEYYSPNALLLAATASIGVSGERLAFASDSIKTGVHRQESGDCSTPRSAVAKTQYGKLRGFLVDGVLTFKGVPYGQTTAGENRWLPAKPPAPWTDEHPALVYGANCPQTDQSPR